MMAPHKFSANRSHLEDDYSLPIPIRSDDDEPHKSPNQTYTSNMNKETNREPRVPTHPIPAFQAAFAESMLEATKTPPQPQNNLKDASERRKVLLDQEPHEDTHASRWKEKPGQRFHELWKLMSQISFGVYLLLNGIAKDDEQVLNILQGHVDEVDQFLETTLEDFDLGQQDIEDRLKLLKVPLQNLKVFDTMLEDRAFRLQIVNGNERIEHIITRTSSAMNDALKDVEQGIGATRQFIVYLTEEDEDTSWKEEQPEMIRVFDAMKGNANGWYRAFNLLQTKGRNLSASLVQLGSIVHEMSRRAGEVSRNKRFSTDHASPTTSSSSRSPTSPQRDPYNRKNQNTNQNYPLNQNIIAPQIPEMFSPSSISPLSLQQDTYRPKKSRNQNLSIDENMAAPKIQEMFSPLSTSPLSPQEDPYQNNQSTNQNLSIDENITKPKIQEMSSISSISPISPYQDRYRYNQSTSPSYSIDENVAKSEIYEMSSPSSTSPISPHQDLYRYNQSTDQSYSIDENIAMPNVQDMSSSSTTSPISPHQDPYRYNQSTSQSYSIDENIATPKIQGTLPTLQYFQSLEPVSVLEPRNETPRLKLEPQIYTLKPTTYTPTPSPSRTPVPKEEFPEPEETSQLSKRSSLRNRFSLRRKSPVEVVEQNDPIIRSTTLLTPPTSGEGTDSAYFSDTDKIYVSGGVTTPSYEKVTFPSSPHIPYANLTHRPSLPRLDSDSSYKSISSPNNDSRIHLRPVNANPNSPLQRPWTAAPDDRRAPPSRMGMSTMSEMTTATTMTDSTQKPAKKKRSPFHWFKKAFSLSEEEKAAFEAKRRAPNPKPEEQVKPMFLDGKRLKEGSAVVYREGATTRASTRTRDGAATSHSTRTRDGAMTSHTTRTRDGATTSHTMRAREGYPSSYREAPTIRSGTKQR